MAPAGSEVFYEVGGKEPTPRPLGEDHGVVVFDYQPVGTGIMNYFRYHPANTCTYVRLPSAFIVAIFIQLSAGASPLQHPTTPTILAIIQNCPTRFGMPPAPTVFLSFSNEANINSKFVFSPSVSSPVSSRETWAKPSV